MYNDNLTRAELQFLKQKFSKEIHGLHIVSQTYRESLVDFKRVIRHSPNSKYEKEMISWFRIKIKESKKEIKMLSKIQYSVKKALT